MPAAELPAGFQFTATHWQQRGEDLELALHYRLRFAGQQHALCERIVFPAVALPQSAARLQALTAAQQLLHWLAGCSYWKASCDEHIEFAGAAPDRWQRQALAQIYRHGLAEFALVNELDQGGWSRLFHSADSAIATDTTSAVSLQPRRRALVPMGGGKDSLVALDLLLQGGIDCSVTAVRPAALIVSVAAATGLPWLPIQRHIDPQLLALNGQGALNGHVPITAINAAILLLAAILYDFEAVVFANEASADEPTRQLADGTAVNHQYSKSSAFELLLQGWMQRYIATDLYCFSILRPFSELAICQHFAGLRRYHPLVSSCNRQFHLHGARSDRRWCGRCPKCLFVYLALAPFLSPQALLQMFAADLLDDPTLLPRYADLCGLGEKPFECVGTVAEARAALLALVDDASLQQQWSNHVVPARLAAALRDGPAVDLATLLAARHPDHIPPAYRQVLPA